MTPHQESMQAPEEQVPVGTQDSVDMDVEALHLAARLGESHSIALPAVLSTPWMVALLECAAARILLPLLAPGQVSVGTTLEIEHLAPTAPGQRVTAHARLAERMGKRFRFEVWAEDGAGVIGRGSHVRAVVEQQAVEGRAAKRAAG